LNQKLELAVVLSLLCNGRSSDCASFDGLILHQVASNKLGVE